MKTLYYLILSLLVSFCEPLKGQLLQDSTTQKQTNNDLEMKYLEKGKTQNTFAWLLLVGGAAALTTGIITMESNSDELNYDGAPAAAIGLVAMAGSVPLFIIGSNNKKKAQIFLQNEPVSINYSPCAPRFIPSVGVRINLTR